jgi:hypothetical protein
MLLHQENGLVTLYNDDGFKIKFIGSWNMPFACYRVSAPLAEDGTFARDADVVAVANCDEIEFYGIGLKLMGMSEFKTGQMFVRGGVKLSQRADATMPEGVGTVTLAQDETSITAAFAQTSLRVDEHVFSVLVTDAGNHPLPLYYTKNTAIKANADGTIESVTLTLDKGESIPVGARVYVMVDTYPVLSDALID